MPGLVRDRYFEYAPERAWDLVTGEAVSPTDGDGDPKPSGPAPAALIELLDHGVEGCPRRFALDAGRTPWRIAARTAAAEAQRRGYVPIAVEVFLRTRAFLVDHLKTRAIVLIAKPTDPDDLLRMALLQAAAISSGPHLLVTPVVADERRVERWRAAEARASYTDRLRIVSRIPLAEDVRQLLARAGRAGELVRRGRHAAAERLLRELAASLARRRAPGPAAQMYMALGRLLLERGGVTSADAAFGEAALQAERADAELLVSARLWQAAARTDAGQLTAAEGICRAVLASGSAGEGESELAEATLGRVLLWQGRVAEAAALPFVQRASLLPYVAATGIRILLETADHFRAGNRARALLIATADAGPEERVIASCAHFRVLLAAGDLTLAGESFSTLADLARTARTPLRLARMRLLWSHALQRAGESRAAARELRALSRMRSAMPPLLRTAIDRNPAAPTSLRGDRQVAASGPADDATLIVTLAQREGDDEEAIKRIGESVLRSVRATRVDLWTADAGPATAVVTCGGGLATRLGQRALDAGILIGPEVVESGWEVAAPVRLGAQLVGALAVRWPADRPRPDSATALLNLACAVMAPRVESLMSAAREAAGASTAIPELVGGSAAMAEVRRAVARAAGAPFSVLIEGSMRR